MGGKEKNTENIACYYPEFCLQKCFCRLVSLYLFLYENIYKKLCISYSESI